MINEAEAAAGRWQDVTQQLMAIVARMPPERWEAPSDCGSWTNRELLSHLATGYVVRIAWLESAIAGRVLVEQLDIDSINERNVAAWRPAPIGAIVAELLATRSRVFQLLEQLEPCHLDAVFDREGRPTSLRDLLTTFSTHDLDHAEQLGRASQ